MHPFIFLSFWCKISQEIYIMEQGKAKLHRWFLQHRCNTKNWMPNQQLQSTDVFGKMSDGMPVLLLKKEGRFIFIFLFSLILFISCTNPIISLVSHHWNLFFLCCSLELFLGQYPAVNSKLPQSSHFSHAPATHISQIQIFWKAMMARFQFFLMSPNCLILNNICLTHKSLKG